MISSEIIDAMVNSGCTAEQIAAVVKAHLAFEEKKQQEKEKLLEIKRLSNRERQARHRMSRDVTRDTALHGVTACDKEKGVSSPPCSPPSLDNPIPPYNPPQLPQKEIRARKKNRVEHPDFEIWYEDYPHKIGRNAAVRSFATAIQKTNLEELRAGLDRYIRTKPPDREWCNPATWLNQERWKDKPNEIIKSSSCQNHRPNKSERAKAAGDRALAAFGITPESLANQGYGDPVSRQLEHLRS